VRGLTPTEKNSLEECGKLRQKTQTQNISHIIETTQAKTACYFLLAGRNGRAQMGMSLKITSQDNGGSSTSIRASFACQAGIDISQENLEEKKKKKVW